MKKSKPNAKVEPWVAQWISAGQKPIALMNFSEYFWFFFVNKKKNKMKRRIKRWTKGMSFISYSLSFWFYVLLLSMFKNRSRVPPFNFSFSRQYQNLHCLLTSVSVSLSLFTLCTLCVDQGKNKLYEILCDTLINDLRFLVLLYALK